MAEPLRARSSFARPAFVSRTPAHARTVYNERCRSPSRQRRILPRARCHLSPKRALVILAVVLATWALYILLDLEPLLVLVRFKLRDRAYEEGWIKQCALRKRPLLFVRGEREMAVVWEMNCEPAGGVGFKWGAELVQEEDGASALRWNRRRAAPNVRNWHEAKLKKIRLDATHIVYHAILPRLSPATRYTYSIAASISGSTPGRVLAQHTFTFPSAVMAISTPPPPTTLLIAAVADNQFNLRTFHAVLRSLLRSLPASHRRPDLLLHAGDAVQNPHNLPQWQTDFWDPITSLLPSPHGQSTPIILARGNHDWDPTGVNAYTGGSPSRSEWSLSLGKKAQVKRPHPGTWFAYSPHKRCRILVLDSNVGGEDEQEQEEWLLWETTREEWKEASIRIAVVHVPPFLEYWGKKAWTEGGESKWSVFVRQRLAPILAEAGTTLVISGHSHTYARGFLPTTLHSSLAAAADSSSVPRAVDKNGTPSAPGVIYTIIGGAGGTLDDEQVEDWGFYEKRVVGKYHSALMRFEFDANVDRRDKGTSEARGKAKEVKRYNVGSWEACEVDEEVLDVLEWSAVGEDRKVLDRFEIEARSCRSVRTS